MDLKVQVIMYLILYYIWAEQWYGPTYIFQRNKQ
jgi:hypothetical protein